MCKHIHIHAKQEDKNIIPTSTSQFTQKRKKQFSDLHNTKKAEKEKEKETQPIIRTARIASTNDHSLE